VSLRPTSKTILSTRAVSLIRADYPGGLVQGRHGHGFGSVTVILSGAVEERVGSRSRVGGPLTVVRKEVGVEHACRWGDAGARTLSLQIDPAAFAHRTDRATGVPWTFLEGGRTAEAVIRLFSAVTSDRASAPVEDLVMEILGGLDDPWAEHVGSPPAWVGRAVEAMRDASPQRPATTELAADAGVHPVHFARVFRRHVGVAPTEFARRLRIKVALDRLASERRATIGHVAHAAGFADHSHLCRELKGFIAVTPTTYRRITTPLEPWSR